MLESHRHATKEYSDSLAMPNSTFRSAILYKNLLLIRVNLLQKSKSLLATKVSMKFKIPQRNFNRNTVGFYQQNNSCYAHCPKHMLSKAM
jgi:hypothetical protein